MSGTDHVGQKAAADLSSHGHIHQSDAEGMLTEIALSLEQRLALCALADDLESNPLSEPIRFAREARLAAYLLPAPIRAALYDFEVSGGGLLLFSGGKSGPLPNTPDDSMTLSTHQTSLARQAAILSAAVGHLVGYRCESGGRLCQTIVPVHAHRRTQISTGSVELESHTEQCFNVTSRPDFLTLACLRGDPDAATYALSARSIANNLPSGTTTLLREERFRTRVDDSFLRGGFEDDMRGPMAVLSGPSSDPCVRYDGDLMVGETIAHTAAMARIRDLWRQSRTCVTLRPGDILMIDNTRVIHGRSQYFPEYDGGDRWLARWQVAKSLAHTRFARVGSSPTIEAIGC